MTQEKKPRQPKQNLLNTKPKTIHVRDDIIQAVVQKAKEMQTSETSIYRALIVAGFEASFGKPKK